MQREVSYRNGKKHGFDREWNKSGKRLWSRHFENGRLIPIKQSIAQIKKQDNVSETLKDMRYVDMYARNYPRQHPLICIKGADFSSGSEMIFVK
ncbi:MAG: hypothetical protein DRQ41_15840, partial [Gammaproteobacteria bacterium]